MPCAFLSVDWFADYAMKFSARAESEVAMTPRNSNAATPSDDDILEAFWQKWSERCEIKELRWGNGFKAGSLKGSANASICVGIDRKNAKKSIHPERKLPRRFKGHDVDVYQTGESTFLNVPMGFPACQAGPPRPGTSVKPIDGNSAQWGTLSLYLKGSTGQTESLFLLTNTHVLIGTGGAALNKDVLSPGFPHCGPQRQLATVVKFSPLVPGAIHHLDAALCRVYPGSTLQFTNQPFGSMNANFTTIDNPGSADPVVMWGAYSGPRSGTILSPFLFRTEIQGFYFDSVFSIDINAQGGDSGALVTSGNRILGIVVGKNDYGTICIPMTQIFRYFGTPNSEVYSNPQFDNLVLGLP